MAINLNAGPTYGYSLLPLFGVDSMLVAQASQAGVTIEQTQPGAFSVGVAGVVVSVVTVKSTAITLAKTGSLGPASAAAAKFQFEAALKKALALVPKESDPLPTGESADILAEATKAFSAGKLAGISTPPALDNVGDEVIDVPVGVVPLAKASKLLQQVSGTSKGSLYTVIALYDGLAVAIRKKPATLSVRVEGQNLGSYQGALSDVGLDHNGSYASAHFSVTDSASRKKVVGAILGTLGLGGKTKIAPLDSLL